MNSQEVKKLAYALGADLCGIASTDRFEDAPAGYRPTDVMPACRSVVSFACAFPVGTLACKTATPYTKVRNTITPKMDELALNLCNALERKGGLAAPVPTNDGEWDTSVNRWRSIVSQKHAAAAAGLGSIGRHSLLITPEYGSMVWLGAVLTDLELEPDPMIAQSVCDDCGLCVKVCPVNALKERAMDQQACWNFAFGDDPARQCWEISCHKCRDVCPHNPGARRKHLLERL